MRLPSRRWCVTVFFVCVLSAWGWRMLVDYKILFTPPKDTSIQRMLLTYTAPTIFGCGLFLVMLFSQLQIKKAILRRIIAFLSPSAFFVYILHTHPLIWTNVLSDRFADWKKLQPLPALIRCIAAALIIFMVCLLIDVTRRIILSAVKGRPRR